MHSFTGTSSPVYQSDDGTWSFSGIDYYISPQKPTSELQKLHSLLNLSPPNANLGAMVVGEEEWGWGDISDHLANGEGGGHCISEN